MEEILQGDRRSPLRLEGALPAAKRLFFCQSQAIHLHQNLTLTVFPLCLLSLGVFWGSLGGRGDHQSKGEGTGYHITARHVPALWYACLCSHAFAAQIHNAMRA